MELIDRYLQAVKFWLPEKQKDDIAAELSEEIDAQIAEREVALGRTLGDAEVEFILKRLGRPVVVANRYLPQRQLIGSVLFPVYVFVLKIVMACVLAPSVLIWLGIMIHSPSYWSSHSWFQALGSLWSSLWAGMFFAVGIVTIVFAVLERVQSKSHFLEAWDPRKLPAVRNPRLIPRAGSSVEVAFNACCVILWMTNLYSPIISVYSGFQITLLPLWRYFFWSFSLVFLVNTILSAVNLWRPYWTVQRAAIRLVVDCAGSALFCWLMRVNILAGFTAQDVSPARAIELVDAINLWMGRMFPWAILVGAAIAAGNIYRIVRLRTARVRVMREATAIAVLMLLVGASA